MISYIFYFQKYFSFAIYLSYFSVIISSLVSLFFHFFLSFLCFWSYIFSFSFIDKFFPLRFLSLVLFPFCLLHFSISRIQDFLFKNIFSIFILLLFSLQDKGNYFDDKTTRQKDSNNKNQNNNTVTNKRHEPLN